MEIFMEGKKMPDCCHKSIPDFVFIPKNRAAKLSGIIYVTFVSRQ
jgi:hypothetical protein